MSLKLKYIIPVGILLSLTVFSQKEKGSITLEVLPGGIVSWVYYPAAGRMNTTSVVVDFKNVDTKHGVKYECETKPENDLVWDREKLGKGRWKMRIYEGTFNRKRLLAVSQIFEIKE